jgi:hypothetical protein
MVSYQIWKLLAEDVSGDVSGVGMKPEDFFFPLTMKKIRSNWKG